MPWIASSSACALCLCIRTGFIKQQLRQNLRLFLAPRALVKRKYRLLFSPKTPGKAGPKGPALELIKIIVEMKQRNPIWGSPKIAQQISLVFGLDINKDVVRRILAQHYRPPPNGSSPSWLTFLGQAKDSLWSVDLFRCESTTLQTHWVLVVLDQFTRCIVGIATHTGTVDGHALCRMFNQAIKNQSAPKYLSSDHDPLFTYHRWGANLRILEIEEIKTVPYVPLSHPFVERVIGTIRRECLDKTLFWNERDLERKLLQFKDYYNGYRTHDSLQGETPAIRAETFENKVIDLANYQWKSHCRGLFQTPIAA